MKPVWSQTFGTFPYQRYHQNCFFILTHSNEHIRLAYTFDIINNDYTNSFDISRAHERLLCEQSRGGTPGTMPGRWGAYFLLAEALQPDPPEGGLALVRNTCVLHFLALSSLASSASTALACLISSSSSSSLSFHIYFVPPFFPFLPSLLVPSSRLPHICHSPCTLSAPPRPPPSLTSYGLICLRTSGSSLPLLHSYLLSFFVSSKPFNSLKFVAVITSKRTLSEFMPQVLRILCVERNSFRSWQWPHAGLGWAGIYFFCFCFLTAPLSTCQRNCIIWGAIEFVPFKCYSHYSFL